jgi:hypothetical protein
MPAELVIDQDVVMVVSENYGIIIYTRNFGYYIEEMGPGMYVRRKYEYVKAIICTNIHALRIRHDD